MLTLNQAIKALLIKKETEYNYLDDYFKDCLEYSDESELLSVQKHMRIIIEDTMFNETNCTFAELQEAMNSL